MSLMVAQRRAYDLAKTLMVKIVLIRIDEQYGVIEASEFDGDAALIVHSYDPFD